MDETVQVLKSIWNDMQEPIGYLPLGLLIGLAAVPLFCVWRRFSGRKGKGDLRWIVGGFLCVVYTAVVWNTVFFSREPGSRTGVNMQLLGTWGDTPTARGYVIENVILFLPFGILFPCALPPLRKGWRCILAALLASIGIEALQFAAERGYCQLDDVLMNTLGAGVGWLVFRAVWGIREGRHG